MINNKSRTALKSIVKECLIELLAEGLVGNNTATLSETRELKGAMVESSERLGRQQTIKETNLSSMRLSNSIQQSSNNRSGSASKSYLDSITMGIDNNREANREREQITKKVQSLTNDSIMSDIFADTAMTTLREQAEGARASGPSIMSAGDDAAKIVEQSDPMDLFGGASSNWANLAFSPSLGRK